MSESAIFQHFYNPRESFTSFYHYIVELIKNKCDDRKKADILDLAYRQILKVDGRVVDYEDDVTEQQKRTINERFSSDDLIFIGYICDLFCSIVLIPALFIHKHLKVDISSGELKLWIRRSDEINERIKEISRYMISFIKQVRGFLRSFTAEDADQRIIGMLLEEDLAFIAEFRDDRNIWFNPPKQEEMDEYVSINNLIMQTDECLNDDIFIR